MAERAGTAARRWLAFGLGLLMGVSLATAIRAIQDPEFHRFAMFGHLDRMLEEQLGRPVAYHEAQGRIPWPQLQVTRRIERAVADRRGEVITVRMARQTGKNETEAFLEDRVLSIFRAKPGSIWIRTAPTYRPQIVNSKLRLEKMLQADPLLKGRTRAREGYIVESGGAQVQFLSAQVSASVVGATASVALSVDEAHKIDKGKFEEDFGPFTASTNAPTILWGVAADGLDLLEEYVQYNQDTDRNLHFPAEVWCELSEAYAAHYAERVRKLGEDHPVILTQYRLIPVEATGAYLNARQRSALFAGDHPRLPSPRAGYQYVLIVDIGGESEVDPEDRAAQEEGTEQDSTAAWIVEVDWRDVPADGFPLARVVDGHFWTNRPHMGTAEGHELTVGQELLQLCSHWHVTAGAIDARGVGEAVAMAVSRQIPSVIAYKATSETVSEDCYDLLARLNAGRVRFWKADPAADPELREVHAQARHTRYEIRGHERMKLVKPTGTGSSKLHIDGVKALTYLHRAIESPEARLHAMLQDQVQQAREARSADAEGESELQRVRREQREGRGRA